MEKSEREAYIRQRRQVEFDAERVNAEKRREMERACVLELQQQQLDEEVARLAQQRPQQTQGRTSVTPSRGEPMNVKHSTAARPSQMAADVALPVSNIRGYPAMRSSVVNARSE